MKKTIKNQLILYACVFFLGILISLVAIIGDPIINKDGYIYLKTAQNFNDMFSKAGLYGWPFYPMMAAVLAKLLFIELKTAFLIINTFFYAAIPLISAQIFTRISQNTRQLPWAILIILCLPVINEQRSDIMRDPGFLFFSLLALFFLVRFAQTQNLRDSLYWQISIVLAFLFRSEAIVWWSVLSLGLFFLDVSMKQRFKLWLQSMSISLTMLLALLVTSMTKFELVLTLVEKFPITSYLKTMKELFSLKSDLIAHQVLKVDDEYATLVLISGLLVLLMVKLFKTIGIVHATVALTGFYKGPSIKRTSEHKILLWGLAACLVTYVFFILTQQFFVSRYAWLGAIVFILYASLWIVPWLDRVWRQSSTIIRMLIVLVFIGSILFRVVDTGTPKYHLVQSGIWVQNQVADSESLMVDDNRILLYGDRTKNEKNCLIYYRDLKVAAVTENWFQHFDNIIIRHKKDPDMVFDALMADPNMVIVHEIDIEKKNGKVLFFKNKAPTPGALPCAHH
jgi:hypothetical protein